MDFPSQTISPLKCALFVDFDNIYIALSKTDPQAAERFASDPFRWLSWLEQGHPVRTGERAAVLRPRSILVRRCYPNPDAGFRRFRSFFTSAAFSVIDCPTMTQTGKNSSDIYMVMDILDALNHKTYFDEFIILSGDSDFMPVLLRLRAHDRRTTTLNIDFMPPAFRAACDQVISEEEFIEDALGISHENGAYPSVLNRSTAPTELLKEMASRVYSAITVSGEVAGASLPEILKDFREFRESTNWLGFGTSQRLAEALAACDSRLQPERINPMMYRIVLGPEDKSVKPQPVVAPVVTAIRSKSKSPAAGRSNRLVGRPARLVGLPSTNDHLSPASPAVDGVPVEIATGQEPEKLEKEKPSHLRDQILEVVKEVVAESSEPLLLARVSQTVVTRIGHQVIDSQWAESGSFKRLLQSADNLGLEITTQPEPGYIFDPHRHSPPSVMQAAEMPRSRSTTSRKRKQADDRVDGEPGYSDYLLDDTPDLYSPEHEEGEAVFDEPRPSLEEFIRRVSRVTGAPDLSSQQFALVFNGIVCELQQIEHGEKVYNTYQSAKAISDWCAERGSVITRGDIMQILKGIIFHDGPRFTKRPGSYTAHDLAVVVSTNIKALCRRSRMEFSEYENHLLDEWILGGLNPSTDFSSSVPPVIETKDENQG